MSTQSKTTTLAERILKVCDQWALEMVSVWCPADHIAHELGLDDRSAAEAICDLVEAGTLDWGNRPLWGGTRDVRRADPEHLDDDECAIVDRIELCQQRYPYGVGLSELVNKTSLDDEQIRAVLDRLSARGRLVRVGSGWRVP